MSDTSDSESRVQDGGRIRRTTIERFNDELSVLDRPLEGEAEYYDDPPRRSPWRRVGMVAGCAAVLGGIGVFALARVSSTSTEGGDRPRLAVALPAVATIRGPSAPPIAPAVGAASPTAAEATAPTGAAATVPAAGAEVTVPAADQGAREAEPEPEISAGGGASPWRLQPSRRAWADIRPGAATSNQVSATHHKSRRHGRHR